MDYFEKIESPVNDLSWNIPEQKQGSINVVGGNSQNFKNAIKISEFVTTKYPIKEVITVLPDSLQNKLPPLPNFKFLPSTDSGSFASSDNLKEVINSADVNLFIGDFSKNTITKKAVASAYEIAEKPLLITRDAVDLMNDENPERILMNENIVLLASMAQLQNLLRAMYYPKMLLLSQSLMQVVEVLHKFTLSYPTKIITLHNGQIILAENGNVKAIPLEKTNYSPLTFWSGELAAKTAALNLYNPNNFLDASICAIFD